MNRPDPLETAIALCADLTDRDLAAGRIRKWTWGPALLGYALTELDRYAGVSRFERWLNTWVRHYLDHPPRVDQSDMAAPGLVTHAMARRTGSAELEALTERVVHYLRHEPRLVDDATNHLGPSAIGRLYPRSVWVDSLMMFGVLAAIRGRDVGESDLVELAARQPEQYAALLQDPDTGLWAHAWWAGRRAAYPTGVFWGRGNGWVLASLPMIVEAIGTDHPRAERIAAILQRTAVAMRSRQRIDGAFNTLLSQPSYRELSAAALAASGWFDGVRLGLLGREFLEPADQALTAVTAAVHRDREGRWLLPEISGPTIPLPLLPRTGYLAVPRGANWDYGVAAFGFAAIAQRRATGG
ncbi:glycoside hydrolase family 88 protein [Enemella dayhoffiae]|uniref:glycoside hydrolase family 88 protein n=1 Tax=Enemella dayhoffiae TaxID=2016507 RepID=UPI001595D9DF|nr:glycoside hydrolase family 88 protein [Enemella dayhoffiae]